MTRTSLLSYSCFFLLLVEVEKEEGIEVEGKEDKEEVEEGREEEEEEEGGFFFSFSI